MFNSQKKYIGIDSNSQEFELYIFNTKPKKKEITVSRDNSAIKELVEIVSSFQPQIAALMSTTTEIELLVNLILDDIRVILISPEKLQEQFNHLEIELSHINAEKLAEFAAIVKPETFKVKEIDKIKIQDLLEIHKELEETLFFEKNRLSNVEDSIKSSLDKHISWLEQREKEQSKQILNILEKYTRWEITSDRLMSDNPKKQASEQNNQTTSVNKLPTKKVIRRYRGQVYEEEVIDYAKVKQLGLNLNKQKTRKKYRGQYID